MNVGLMYELLLVCQQLLAKRAIDERHERMLIIEYETFENLII